jgi:hypothetical protein
VAKERGGPPRVLAQAQARLAGDAGLTMFTMADVMVKVGISETTSAVHSIYTSVTFFFYFLFFFIFYGAVNDFLR